MQTSKNLLPFLRRRVSAFVGATVVVVVLWLVTVVSVNIFGSSPTLDDRDGRFVKGVAVRVPPGTAPNKHEPVVVFLHNTGGNQSDFTAWHTVVQVLILVTLAALVVAAFDQVRRKNRKRRRPRTA